MSKMLAVLVAFFAAAWFAAPALANGTNPSTGYIEICKYATGSPTLTGMFHFTVNDEIGVDVEVGHCSTPIEVPAGTATVAEAEHPWYEVAAQNYVTSDGVTHVVAEPDFILEDIPVTAGGISKETVVNYTNDPVMGNLEICKTAAATSGLTGTFTFKISSPDDGWITNIAAPADRAVSIPGCTVPFAVPAGVVEVSENATNDQTYVTDISVQPGTALVASDLHNAWVKAQVVAGRTSETMVTFENSQSSLKVCKATHDAAVADMAPFSFSVSVDGVSAGTFTATADLIDQTPSPDSCTWVPVKAKAGSLVTIKEATVAGTFVSDMWWNDKSVLTNTWVKDMFGDYLVTDPAARIVTFPIHAGVNAVTFVNDPAPRVPLKICKLGTVTGPFSFTVAPAAYAAAGGTTVAPTSVTVPGTGQCGIVGWYPYDQTVTITEAAGNLTNVAVDLTSATATLVGTPNLATRTAMVLVGNYDLIEGGFAADWAIVNFTNGPGSTIVPPPATTPQPQAQTQPVVATPAAVAPPTKVVAPAKVAVLKVASSRIVTIGKARYVVVRVNGTAKTARIHVTLINKQHKVVGRFTRYVATNKAVRVGNLRLTPSILSVRVSL